MSSTWEREFVGLTSSFMLRMCEYADRHAGSSEIVNLQCRLLDKTIRVLAKPNFKPVDLITLQDYVEEELDGILRDEAPSINNGLATPFEKIKCTHCNYEKYGFAGQETECSKCGLSYTVNKA